MYGPVIGGTQFTWFVEVANGNILAISGVPFLGNLANHTVVVCFETEAMAKQFVQLSVADGQCNQGEWAVLTYSNDAAGRAKVAASNASHLAALHSVQPMNASAKQTTKKKKRTTQRSRAPIGSILLVKRPQCPQWVRAIHAGSPCE